MHMNLQFELFCLDLLSLLPDTVNFSMNTNAKTCLILESPPQQKLSERILKLSCSPPMNKYLDTIIKPVWNIRSKHF